MILAQINNEPGGLTASAHVLMALTIAFAIGFVLFLVRRRQLSGKYALLWLAAVIPLGILAVFPGLLTWIADQAGVFYPPTLILVLAVVFLFMVAVQFSYEFSALHEQVRTLAEELALMRAENEREDR